MNTQLHETVMKNILRDIYAHPQLQAQLSFKGGTCLYFFYGLPRFSTDLDFSLKFGVNVKEINPEFITEILKKYLTIEDQYDKYHTLYWSGSYEKNQHAIKVEINKREFLSDEYQENDFFGLTVSTFDLPTMFAHKLCAIMDRKKLVNRDLYDAWWLFKKFIPINEAVIKERTGKTLVEYLVAVKQFINERADSKHILQGLGELLSVSQKDWVRDHLLTELYFQIDIRREEMSDWNFNREFKALKELGMSDPEALAAAKEQIMANQQISKAFTGQYKDKQ